MKIGVDIGGSHIAVGIIDENDNLIVQKQKDLMPDEKCKISIILKNMLIQMIEEVLCEKNIEKKQIKKIGFAVPGRVDKYGNIYTVNLNLKNYPLKAEIEEYFKIPVQVRNDAKCASLAEKRYGSLKNYENAVFLCLGTGIGSSVFVKNEMLSSNISEAFEIGHMIIKKDGIKCNCGKNGCFEKYAAMSVFKNNVEKLFNLKETSGEEILKIILKENKNETLQKIIDEYIDNLAIGIINMIEIFEPEAICIGGSFVHFKEIFLNKLKEKINKYPHFNPKVPEIVLAKMGNNAGIIGAVLE